MSEREVVYRTKRPNTVSSMINDLKQLSVEQGDRLLVHSSMSSLGWVCGGPQAVIEALMASVGSEGTIITPAQSGDWSDPSEWGNPAVPEEWLDTIYEEMPAFDPTVTPTRAMGKIAELFRTYPGTLRSGHPQVSFCANGKDAAAIVSDHALTPQFGMNTPLGKLYELKNTKVLLMGVGFNSCTSFHLAETKLVNMPTKKMGTAILEQGNRVWKWFSDFIYDTDDFEKLGEQFVATGSVREGKIGEAKCMLFHLQEAVDFAEQWLAKNR